MQVKIWVSNFKLQEILRINKDIVKGTSKNV
jgi:hypothetical protein